MVNFPGRSDRRRRVLKEDVLSASSARAAQQAGNHSDTSDNAPRYSDAAGVENHPQITDFVPRRYATIAMVAACGVGVTALTAALHHFVLPMAVAKGMNSAVAFDLAARGNLADWSAAIVLFLASCFCVLTYSIRRHRIDDYRGRYRVWVAATLACLVLSANSVVGLHEVVSDVLTRVTGWSALRGGAAWWLAAGGLPMAWVFGRVLLDIRDCRIGAASLMTACVCYAVSGASYFGLLPALESRVQRILTAAPMLLGHWLLFTAIVANARFVVLDAQGLITVRRRLTAKRTAKAPAAKAVSKASQSAAASSSSSATVSISRQTVQTVKTPADSSRWVDGSRPEREVYDEEDDDSSVDGRKLSKSDRKRLRKMKAQGRAA